LARSSPATLWKEFNSDFPAELLGLNRVDLAPAAAPELLDDAAVRDGLADERKKAAPRATLPVSQAAASQRSCGQN